MSTARLWRDHGKPQQARDLVAPIYGWFMKDTRDLRRLKAVLDALAACAYRKSVQPHARRGCKRLDTSTQGEYTKSRLTFENVKDFNVSKKQSQILPLRPAFLTTKAVMGNDMGDETRRHDRPRPRGGAWIEHQTTNLEVRSSNLFGRAST
jgi:hypothetical protein